MELLKENNLRVNVEICHFMKKSVAYLGQQIDENGLKLFPERVQAIMNLEIPDSKRMLRGFIGSVNYYRPYIKDLSKFLAPLTSLTSRKVRFQWKVEHTLAVQKVKKAIARITYLSFPEPGVSYTLFTDVSSNAVGGVLI